MATNEKEFNEYIDPIVDILPMNLSYAEKLKLLKDRFQLPKDYLDLPNDPLTTSILQSTMEKARMDANNPKYDYESTGYWPSFKANKKDDKMIQQLEVEDPGLILRSAAITNKNRRDRNMDTAAREYAQAQDDFDRTFNPTDYGRRRSGRVMPLGGRAGMMNLYRPQYNADMNQSINADENVVLDNKRLRSANSLEAERNKAKGFLGINKRDDGSTYFTGSEQVRQNLEKSIADYDKEIAKLQAEIAMSEAGDPMYDLAVMRMVMNDDMSLMNDIRGRIGKKIDQEFQIKQKKADQKFQHEENELTRESNKQDLDTAKKKDLKHAYERALQTYEFAVQDFKADPSKPELKRNVEKARMLLRQAASDADMLDDYYRMFEKPEDNSTLADFDKAFVEYEVEGIEGLKNYVNSLKNPKEKARVLRDLKNSFGITEGDLGLSGAETKINQKKADANDALDKSVKAEVGKTFDSGKAATDYLNTLPKNVRDRLTAKYDKASKKTKIVKRN